MKLYALISDDNKVSGIVETPSESQLSMLASLYGQAIDVTEMSPMPQIGWSFDGQNIVGTSHSKKITKLAMRQRFTVPEMLAIMGAVSDPAKIIVRYLMDNLQVATFVDLARPDTQAGLQVLVQYGLLTQDRANTILTAPVTPVEAYRE